ncbi:MAG: MATE family efflux transporter [Candidatus Eisenbacteria sp.]|nr:MATE family efflux transporter [Candidatus Eisenbacteria bacterium]
MKPATAGRDMTQGPLARNLLAVAWPVMLSFLLHTLYNLVDAFWLGKLGKAALVAPTITMNVIFIGMSVAMGLGMGGTTLVSQYRGAGQVKEMGRAGGQTLILLSFVGLGIAIIGFIFAVPILKLLQTPPDAFGETLIYLRWILVGMPCMFAFFVYQGIYTGMGDTVGPLQVNAITVLLNVVLDPILIFGIGPFPEMGVAGAALATCLSRGLASCIGLYRLFRGNRGFRLQLSDLRWDRGIMIRILRIGVPMSLGQTGTSLGFTLLMGIVNTFGSAVTAAFGIGHRIIHMALVPMFGLSQANATAVGQNLGADQPERAARSVRISALMTGLVLLPITTMMFCFGDSISRLFINDPEVIQYGHDLFRITSSSVFAFGFVMVILGSFQGSGHTVPVMVLNLSRLWVIRIPAAFLLAIVLGMGPTGLWWAMFLSNTLTAIAAFIWFSTGTWKRKVIEPEIRPADSSRVVGSVAGPVGSSMAAGPEEDSSDLTVAAGSSD